MHRFIKVSVKIIIYIYLVFKYACVHFTLLSDYWSEVICGLVEGGGVRLGWEKGCRGGVVGDKILNVDNFFTIQAKVHCSRVNSHYASRKLGAKCDSTGHPRQILPIWFW